MTTTVVTSSGNYTWTNDYGNEVVDSHAHEGNDFEVPIVVEKTIADNDTYIKFQNESNSVKMNLMGNGDCDFAGSIVTPKIITDDIDILDGALL